MQIQFVEFISRRNLFVIQIAIGRGRKARFVSPALVDAKSLAVTMIEAVLVSQCLTRAEIREELDRLDNLCVDLVHRLDSAVYDFVN